MLICACHSSSRHVRKRFSIFLLLLFMRLSRQSESWKAETNRKKWARREEARKEHQRVQVLCALSCMEKFVYEKIQVFRLSLHWKFHLFSVVIFLQAMSYIIDLLITHAWVFSNFYLFIIIFFFCVSVRILHYNIMCVYALRLARVQKGASASKRRRKYKREKDDWETHKSTE